MGDDHPNANEPTKNATDSWSWGTTESYSSLPRALLFVVVSSTTHLLRCEIISKLIHFKNMNGVAFILPTDRI